MLFGGSLYIWETIVGGGGGGGAIFNIEAVFIAKENNSNKQTRTECAEAMSHNTAMAA